MCMKVCSCACACMYVYVFACMHVCILIAMATQLYSGMFVKEGI